MTPPPAGEPRTALTLLSAGDAFDRATHWATRPADERKRRAMEACRDYDGAVLWQLTDAWLTTYGGAGARTSVHTRRAYRRGVEDLTMAWRTAGVSLLRPPRDAGPLWVRGLEATRRSPSTVCVRLAGVRALYAALRWCGATEADPFRDARPAKDPTPREEKRKPYSMDELEALLAAATPVERALVLLAAHGGLRAQEIVDLSWGTVHLAHAELTVLEGKGHKQRTVLMSRPLVVALAAIRPREAEPSLPVVPFRTTKSAWVWMGRLCRRAGVPQRGVHAGRHHAGTRLVQQTGNLEIVARHLGHASLDTARIYAKWSDERLKTAIAQW